MKFKLLLVVACFTVCNSLYAQQSFPFANEVKIFKHQDSLHFPKPAGLLFIGSSSIRLWTDLEQRFPQAPIVKRGVGGSELSQWVTYYAPYLIYPYRAQKIFIYAGENDIAAGKSAESVAGDFAKLWDMIRRESPQSTIYWLSIKQSPSRAKYYAEVTKANRLIKNYIKGKSKTFYVDLSPSTLNPATHLPDSSLFKADYLHLNSTGYDKWQAVLSTYMK